MLELHPIFLFVFAAFAGAYLTRVLLLSEEETSAGPLIFGRRWSVFFEESGKTRVFGLFDALRFLFGAYVRRGNVFSLRFAASDVWRCHWCLSFWLSLAFCPLVGLPLLLSFSLAGAVNLIILVYDALQMWSKA